jgi:hypothetical protein
MDPAIFELSLEQQFELARFGVEATTLTQEQVADLLIDAAQNMMLKDNLIKHLLMQAHAKTGSVRL